MHPKEGSDVAPKSKSARNTKMTHLWAQFDARNELSDPENLRSNSQASPTSYRRLVFFYQGIRL